MGDWSSRFRSRRAGALAIAALAVPLALSCAQPARAASFDCTKATTAVEKMICADAELSKLDEALGRAYADALAQGTDADTAALKSEQRIWLRNSRDACADALCLKAVYEARNMELTKAATATRVREAGDARPMPVEWSRLFEVGRPAALFALVDNGRPDLCEPLLKSLNRPWPSDGRSYPFILLRNDYLLQRWEERVLTWRSPGGAIGKRYVDAAFIDIDGDGIEDGVFRENSALSGRDFQNLMLVLSIDPVIRKENPISESHAREITAHFVRIGRQEQDLDDPDPRHFVELVRLEGRHFILTSRAYFWTLEGRRRHAKIELFQVDKGIERVCLLQAVREISDYR